MIHFTQAILRGEGDPVRALCLHLGERVEHGEAPLRHGPQREAPEGQDRMNTMSSMNRKYCININIKFAVVFVKNNTR